MQKGSAAAQAGPVVLSLSVYVCGGTSPRRAAGGKGPAARTPRMLSPARLFAAVAALSAASAPARARGLATGEGAEPSAPPPALDCSKPESLPRGRVWTTYADGSARAQGLPPPARIPEALLPYFTRCGDMEVADLYVDDTNGGRGVQLGFGRAQIDAMARQYAQQAERERYALPEALVLRTLDAHPPAGARVLVYGSMRPWVEG